MKKLVTLLLAAGLVCSFSSPASAVELKASGTFDFAFERTSLNPYNDASHSSHFNALERVRVAFDFIASEQLSGRYMFQVGTGFWGDTTNSDFSQGQRSGANAQINTRMAYVDWLVPGTAVKVSMGKKPLALPAFAIAGFIQDGITNSIQVSAPINDNFAVTAFWMRPLADPSSLVGTENELRRFGDVDVFGVTVPMKFTGFDFVPYGLYGMAGNKMGNPTGDNAWGNLAGRNSLDEGNSQVWWLGFASRLTMFDPFTFALDAAYGSKTTKSSNGNSLTPNPYEPVTTYNDAKSAERAGWYVAALASYKTPYGVPTLKTWYASGDKGNQTKRAGNMPTLGTFMPGSLGAANTYFDGAWGIGNTSGVMSGTGVWAVSAQWNQASFIEDLFHDFSVTYVRGTNHVDNVKNANYPNVAVAGYKAGATPIGYLTTKDSFLDVNFTSTYSIYKNLATSLELGYLFENFNEDIRATAYNADGTISAKPDFKNIWRVAVNFKYTF